MRRRETQAPAFGMVDGRLQRLEELVVPATDRGLLLGDAVFETLRTYDGRLFALDAHLDRLQASLRGIRITDAPSRDQIATWVRETTTATLEALGAPGGSSPPDDEDAPACVVRVTVTRGSGGHGLSTQGVGPARVIVIARPLPPPPESVYTKGLRVVTASLKRAPVGVQDPTIKATSALNLILARQEADEAGADEALLTNGRGEYLEASAANLFVLREGSYWTPRGRDGVLEGVTAGIVEGLLREEGWHGHHGPIPASVLREGQEVLLTQTTREVLPVVRLDDEVVGSGRPGEMAARLRGRFRERRAQYLDPGP